MTVTVTELANGMRVATDHMPQVDTVSLGIWVGVGTRDEGEQVNGIAHLLEHMTFKGTDRRSAREIAEVIEDVGGHLNAYTTREQTAYYAKVLAEDSDLAIDVVADILQHSVFDDEELKRERAVVIQEIGQAVDTPDDIIFDHFQATAFPGQPLGRPVLGEVDIVERLNRSDLISYLGTHYGAHSMIAVAAGNIEHQHFVDQIEAAFGGLSNGHAVLDAQSQYQGGHHADERDLEQVHLVVGFPSVGALDPDYYAHSLYSTVLGGGMSSRLFQEVREKRGLVYSIYSFASSYRDSGLFGIYAGTGEEDLPELVPVLCDELTKLAKGIDEPELRRARAQLRAGLLMSRESTSARGEALAQHLITHGRPLTVAELLAELDRVTPDDIARVAARMVEQVPTIVSVGPSGGFDTAGSVKAALS
jgi:predicted Zn-dependent peptidase